MLLSLRPGHSLGPFELGSLLSNVINLLRSSHPAFPIVALSWDQNNPAAGFILIQLSIPPLHLLFHGPSQRLLVIEAYSPNNNNNNHHSLPSPPNHPLLPDWIAHKNIPFSHAVGPNEPGVTCRVIHRLFGPTYPPTPHVAHPQESVVAYPGVTFSFLDAILTRVILSIQPLGTHHDDKPIANLSEAYFKPKLPKYLDSFDGDIKRAQITIPKPGSYHPPSLIFTFHSSSPSRPIPDIKVTIGQYTSEDVMCDFGAPLRTFWKEDPTRIA